MATKYPRKNRWWLSWRPPGRARQKKSTGLTLDKELEAEAMRLRFEVLERKAAGIGRGLQRFGDLLTHFMAAKEPEVEAKTLRRYRDFEKHLRADHMARLAVDDVKPEHVRAYLAARSKAAAPQTVNHERSFLRAVWRWAQAEEVTDRNPVLATKPQPIRRKPREPMSMDDKDALVAALRADAAAVDRGGDRPRPTRDAERWIRELLADLVEVLYWTGWRFGEACKLRAVDVDREAMTCPLTSAANKGWSERSPIAPEAMAVLAPRCDLGALTVFCNIDGTPAYKAIESFVKRWKRDRPEWRSFSLHRLRHAYATDLHLAGIGGDTARRLTRHRSIHAHAVYQHAPLEELRAAQERLATWRLQQKKAKP